MRRRLSLLHLLGAPLLAAGLGAIPAAAQPAAPRPERAPPADHREHTIRTIAVTLPELWQFLSMLSERVGAGALKSTDALIEACRAFYTPSRMQAIEAVIPGWKRMASYDRGKTLWHINVAMVALLQLDEYKVLPPNRQAIQHWIVLLHDLAKEPTAGRDHRHGFRSAAMVARILPALGFPVTPAHDHDSAGWFKLTDGATRLDLSGKFLIQDNSKLPEIMAGAKQLFPEPTRSAVAAIALHQSITSLAAWPVAAPMSREQIAAYIDGDLHPALLALTLADSGGWNLFDPPTLAAMYKETRAVFAALPRAAAN